MKPSSVRLEGDLDFFPVFDLLQWLEQAGKTGMLRIGGGGGERSLCIRDGRIIFASSRCKGQRFGEFLAARGSIDEARLREALEASQQAGLTFTRYLVDQELVTQETLETAVFDLVQTILENLFEAHEDRMHFSFVDTLPQIVSEGVIQFQSGHLIMETVRRLDERVRDQDRSRRRLAERKTLLYAGQFTFPTPSPLIAELVGATLPDVTGGTQGGLSTNWVARVLADEGRSQGLKDLVVGGVLKTFGIAETAHLKEALVALGPVAAGAAIVAREVLNMVPMEHNRSRIGRVLRHCIESGFVAHALARDCGVDPGTAFLAGLMHEMGKTVILNLEETKDLSEQDLNLFMTEAHLVVGSILTERWGLSREVQSALRYQYNFRMAGSHRRLAAVIQLVHSLVSDAEEGGQVRFEEEAARFLGLEQAAVEKVSRPVVQALAPMFS